MKYIYTEGPYREFRGRVFANYNPVEIDDRGTLEAVQRDPSFKPFVETQETPKIPNPDACPKCGKIVRQGHYMHVKWCKGASNG